MSRTLPLDHKAGLIAAKLASQTLSTRESGEVCGAVKYDALIYATAVANNASKLLVEDQGRNFRAYRNGYEYDLELVIPSQPSAQGQVVLFQKKGKSTASG